ncbi:MAG: diguanylate cyclase [Oscillospiraceae bacterium]|jgi:diguanylate cyclase (GGDEF)-like protein/PAS domain S-box-containing protein|nr:diguanylate cyclase [Oscillospiraceae bacterium]
MKIGLKPLLSLVLLVTILVPVIAVTLTGISASRTQAEEIITDEVAALSIAQAVGFDVLLDECAQALHSLSRLDEIQTTANGNYSSVRDDVTGLFENTAATVPHLLDIIVTDANGIVCIDFFGNAGALFPAFDEAGNLARNEVFKSEIALSNPAYGGADTFFLLGRINNDEVVYGYICMVFTTEVFAETLANSDFFDGEGAVFITDRKGTALGLNGTSAARMSEIGSDALRNIVNGVVTSGREGDSGSLNSNSYVGSFGSINGNKSNVKNGWYWFGTYPVSAIDTVPMLVRVMIIVVAVISAACLVFAFIIIRNVTVPPQDIVKKMRRINEGDMDERLMVKGTDEYAYISEAFNEMLDEVLISGEMHRAISELSDNMLFEWDFRKESLFVSDNFAGMFEVETERATLINGRFIDSLMEKEDIERYKVDIDKLLRSRDSMHGEYQVTTKTGSIIWVSIRAHCVLDRLGELLRIIGVITNINNEKLLSLQLSERASYDFLSGLYNRNTFMRELQSEITRSATSRVGVIFIDVDDFKFINDKYGHNTGDEIIKCVANIIKDKLGSAGFAGRFGGDEFVMCVTEEETLNNIGKLAAAVLELFDKGYYTKEFDITLKIKASLGIAISPEHGRDNESILAAADEAMYFVKKNGKSNYHIYNPKDSVLTELMRSI